MLSRDENELLTRVGPGTPMGEMMRRYWMPALLSEEIREPDGAPVRVRIMGEELVAFRDTQGRVGLLEEYCPHRRASLVYGRNEENGLRCIYHGWKMDVDGNVVDMPCEPPGTAFKDKVKQRAYPTREIGGMIWAYLGPPEKEPAFRMFEWMKLPETNWHTAKPWQDCNYLQAVEGGIDSSHISWLHRDFGPPAGQRLSSLDGAPLLEIKDTPYGFHYAAIRKHPDPSKKYVRITPFIFPFHTIVPFPKGQPRNFHAWVPIDDYNTWTFFTHYNPFGAVDGEAHSAPFDLDHEYRRRRNLSNMHLQNREMMKTKNFSGIPHIPTQDHAVQESMGPIVDRSKEHLGTSDIAVIHLRRFMLKAVRDFVDGKEAPGLDPSIAFDRIDSDAKTIPLEQPWDELGDL